MALRMSRGATVALIAFVGTLSLFLLRLPRFAEPLHSDESAALLLAQTQKSGGVIYRDQWNSHAPGLFLLLAAMPEALLRNEAWVRLLGVLSLGAAAGLLADLALRAGLRAGAAAAGAATFLLLNANCALLGHYLETEQLGQLLLVASAWWLCARRNAAMGWLFAGIALAFKQSFVAWLPPLIALDWLLLRRERSPRWADLLPRAAVALPLAACALYFLSRGALSDFVRCTAGDALGHVRMPAGGALCSPWHLPLGLLAGDYSHAGTPPLLLAMAAALAVARGIDRAAFAGVAARSLLPAAAALTATGLAYLFIQHCGRTYYLQMLYPGLALALAWASDWAAGFRASAPPARRPLATGLLAALIAGMGLLAAVALRPPRPDAWSRRLDADRLFARLLAERLPDHRIYAAVSQPGWYWYARQPAPRHVWALDMLRMFPGKEAELVADAADYGRGRRLLILFYRWEVLPLSGAASTEMIKLRGRFREAGARPFELPPQVPPVLLTGYEIFEWDLRDCRPRPAACPPLPRPA